MIIAESRLNHAAFQSSKCEPVSLRSFADSNGLSYNLLRKYCNQGRVIGARQHVRTKHWWIYPPAKIVPSQLRW
ncbi:hypothetical protein [Methylotenera sp.]|uniref:hypothetical protein n=1 Tax=Methylotenera sp. TaxID=2051956 RepID=UPI0027307314|nr:hypothetical protein [Methylotenera sp.]MDP2071553.1 hypothetical protein [Methylotenera sp.]MDP3004924.1 hypothetical protein [Methylotenera sp.]MDP3307106.1 hypothetical protein [Methylotenera sp.]